MPALLQPASTVSRNLKAGLVQSFTLSPVPPALVVEFKAYHDYRLEPLNRMRDGSCVVTLTADNDVATCTRFLGWLKATQPDEVIGLEPAMGRTRSTR